MYKDYQWRKGHDGGISVIPYWMEDLQMDGNCGMHIYTGVWDKHFSDSKSVGFCNIYGSCSIHDASGPLGHK
jgi:hypothetical protein